MESYAPVSSATLATRVIASYCSKGSSISTRSILQPCGTKTPKSTAIEFLLRRIVLATRIYTLIRIPQSKNRRSALGERPPPVGVTGDDEEEVREPVYSPEGVRVLRFVAGCDQASLRAPDDGAGDVEEGAEPALAGDDELLGDLCFPPPLFEGFVHEPQVLLSHRVRLFRHRHVAHDAVEEPLQPEQQLTDIAIGFGAGEAEEGTRLVHVSKHDDARVVLAHPARPEQGRGPVVAAAGRDRRVALAHRGLLVSQGGFQQGSVGGAAPQASRCACASDSKMLPSEKEDAYEERRGLWGRPVEPPGVPEALRRRARRDGPARDRGWRWSGDVVFAMGVDTSGTLDGLVDRSIGLRAQLALHVRARPRPSDLEDKARADRDRAAADGRGRPELLGPWRVEHDDQRQLPEAG